MVKDDMTNRQMFDLLMEEMAAIHRELTEKIEGGLFGLRTELKGEIKGLRTELKGDIKELNSKMNLMNLKMDQNFLTFMNHVENYDRRLTALEVAK